MGGRERRCAVRHGQAVYKLELGDSFSALALREVTSGSELLSSASATYACTIIIPVCLFRHMLESGRCALPPPLSFFLGWNVARRGALLWVWRGEDEKTSACAASVASCAVFNPTSEDSDVKTCRTHIDFQAERYAWTRQTGLQITQQYSASR